ncbi:MAG: TPR end-of-group domain-containing protein [Methanosarcinaceae archaeon]
MQRNIKEIKENLIQAKERGKKCTLLIGAGCSVKAGIPLASGFVNIIKEDHNSAYERASEKTYPKVMDELHPGNRRDLIAEYIDNAKINWAHICIALLIKEGYVDRVLTTNFDPLVVRACALLNEFPAVYDFAASQLFKPADVADKAIFHLHGQRGGFVLLNTDNEFKKFSKHLKPVFEDSDQGRMWIVVGYSGDNDPVFDHLVDIDRFNYGLYWIGYKDNEPSEHLRKRLLVEGKDAYFVEGYDADSFFVRLTQELGIFPPDFIGSPFSHMDNLFEMITDFPIDRQEEGTDVTHEPRKQIKECIDKYEKEPSDIQKATKLLMEGNYDKVVKMHSSYNDNSSPEFVDVLSWGYIGQGNALYNLAKIKDRDEAEELFKLSFEKYDSSLKIKPDDHKALYNWGTALSDLAKIKDGDEAKELFKLSFEKYDSSLKIKPDDHEALNNWGNALSDLAKIKDGDEAEELFKLSFEKYDSSLKIKPDDHDALNNWGNALIILANTKSGRDTDDLLFKAKEKILQAEDIKKGSGAYNLACISALQNDEPACQKWLELAYKLNSIPESKHLNSDSDLDDVRETDWFKKIVADMM